MIKQINNNKILVDVIIPVYNVEPYLDDFFVSLVRQKEQCFNLIIVYDKSEDNSIELIKKYEPCFNGRFFLIENDERKGLGHARNVALNSGLMSAKYFAFLDPDDLILDDFFSSLVKEAEKNKSDLVICGFERFDDKTNECISVDMVNNQEIILELRNDQKAIFYNISVWNKLYLSEKYLNFRFDEIKRCEDLSFTISVFSKSTNATFINRPLYRYRVRQDSLSQTFDIIHLKSVLQQVALSIEKFKNDISLYNLVCGMLFVRICLGILLRIYSYNKNYYKQARKMCLTFMNSFYPKWRKTKFLSYSACKKNGKKSMAVFLYKKLFMTLFAKLLIKWYVKRSRKRKKEIHW